MIKISNDIGDPTGACINTIGGSRALLISIYLPILAN
jgi:hypothetical protein